MEALLTKLFHFSASHALGDKIYGHNYVLGVTVKALSLADEKKFQDGVQSSLIQSLESSDLGLDVDFLKGQEISDENLLRIFWKILEKALSPITLISLSLERDSRTKTCLGRS
jgi:6-pyruvoyl-tetrahydropterin synthase